jgi:hypothetical protein
MRLGNARVEKRWDRFLLSESVMNDPERKNIKLGEHKLRSRKIEWEHSYV